jgi:hypothetical protein
VIGAVLALYVVFQDLLGNLFSSTRRARLDGDFTEMSNAISRYELDKKKNFQEWDVDQLQGSTLSNAVRDPDGRPYVYDWFFRRLVYTGPDGTLQTTVPGKGYETGTSDDEVRELKAWDRLVYARLDDEGKTILEMANTDGSGAKTLATVEGTLLDVRGLAAAEANLLTVSLRTATGSQLGVVDVSAQPVTVTPISKGDKHDAWPTPFGAKTEWVFYQSDADGSGNATCRSEFDT